MQNNYEKVLSLKIQTLFILCKYNLYIIGQNWGYLIDVSFNKRSLKSETSFGGYKLIQGKTQNK